MRRKFVLPPKDVFYLDSLGLPWETIGSPQQGGAHVLVHQFPVPPGFTVPTTTVALRIEQLYPDVQIDMAYFNPALSRSDGRVVHTVTPVSIDGQIFQQWSRHRTSANPWRPGIDCLATHLGQVEHWLSNELIR